MALSSSRPRPGSPPLLSRRAMLCSAGLGFGAWALLDLLTRHGHWPAAAPAGGAAADGPAPRAARAKRVIFLFMQGGPSHIDTFDPKPLLNKLHGQPLPASATAGLRLQFTKSDAAVLGCPQ